MYESCYLKPEIDFITDDKKIVSVCCRSCREYVFERNDILAELILELKIKKGPCVDCRESNIKLLEFDHINRETKLCCVYECRSKETILQESEKCDMRCIICHIRRTKIQLNYKNNIKINQKYVDDLKREIGGCQLCGWYDENLLEALHFDHIDQTTKSDNVSTLANNNSSDIKIIKEEITKCRLICAHCHKLHTIEQLGYLMYSGDRREARKEKIKMI